MSRVYRNHRTTPFLGLVRNVRLESRKRPRVHPALRLRAPLGLHVLAHACEVFQHNRCTRLSGRNNLLGEDVIGSASKAGTATFQRLKASIPCGYTPLYAILSRQTEARLRITFGHKSY